MTSLHINTVRAILREGGFRLSSSGANGRIRGLTTSNGDIGLSNHRENQIEITSRRGNLARAVRFLRSNGFTVSTWTHPSGISTRIIVSR